ncbi:unnamed protein product [Withania somnifera]
MQSEKPAPNPAADQLPEAESLPDGFVADTSSTDQMPPKTPENEQENLSQEVTDYKEEKLVDPELNAYEECDDSRCKRSHADVPEEEQVRINCQNMDNSEGDPIQNSSAVKETSLPESVENKKEASETKRKTVKRTFKSEKEFLEFTLKYQQVLAERDSAIAVRDKLESLCRELQRQNKVLMEECRRVSSEGQNLRLDLSNKFQDAIKLKQKTLELQLADLKIKQHEEKLQQEQSQMKIYADQVLQLLATEKNLRLQLTADGEKFQQFQEALLKSNEVFETFKQDIEKMAKSIKELKKENAFLKGKCDKSDFTLIELAEEREFLKKQLEKTRNQKEKLEALCRSLQAERKSHSLPSSNSDSVQA